MTELVKEFDVSYRTCSVEDCNRRHVARGLCPTHYRRLMRSPQAFALGDANRRVCEHPGCNLPHAARGLCHKHHRSVLRSEGKSSNRRSPNPTREQYIEERVTVLDDGCWNWTMYLYDGYGKAIFGGVIDMAHRFSYETHVGPIPEGLHIDHLCRNRACVNPDHLEPVTLAENLRRGREFRCASAFASSA